jgi:hypothetical protein
MHGSAWPLERRALHPALLPRGSEGAEDDGDDGQAGAIPGARVCHTAFAAHTPPALRTSLYWFGEYVWAVTGGRLPMRVEVHWLDPDRVAVEVPLGRMDGTSCYLAQADGRTLSAAFATVPPEFADGADCWAVFFPSGVPNDASFARSEFITGGMSVAPDGCDMFNIDDLWLTRIPPHLGAAGPYHPVERLAYLPQWWQHEWFHALFNSDQLFADAALEPTSHSWHNLDNWPEDFEGAVEPDYYHECLHKRFLLPDAHPPLWYRLKRWGWTPEAERALALPDMLLGSWRLREPSNDWHYVTIEAGPDGTLRWRNRADVEWSLELNAEKGRLIPGQDCPYEGTMVQIVVEGHALEGRSLEARLARGGRLAIKGLAFNAELYVREG